MPEPTDKRAVAFIDGQNLFHSAKEAFGYTYPSYDVKLLAEAICQAKGWQLHQVRFYTGVPDRLDNALWNYFWSAKIAHMGRHGVWTYSRPLRYQNKVIRLPDGTEHTTLVGREKGIDVRLALDVVRLILEDACNVILIFSQDQDLSEVADEVRSLGRRYGRWIKLASAYPSSPTSQNRRGINKTDWIPIDRATFDRCLDTRDYRPKP